MADSIKLTEEVHVKSRHYYSIAWLQAADWGRHLSEDLISDATKPDQVSVVRVRSHVLSAVVASWAFLESNINELFDDATHYLDPAEWSQTTPAPRGATGELQVRMAALWPHIDRLSTLDKYDVALALAEAQPIERGSEPGQSAVLLGKLRNHFIHYQPFSVRDGVAEGADAKLAASMARKITLPSWDTSKEALFPYRIICPNLARWSVRGAVRYVDEFFVRSAIRNEFDHVRPSWL